MPTIVDHLSINVPSGTQEFGPLPVPNGVQKITFRLARCATLTPALWPNNLTFVKMQSFLSVDDGQTYLEWCGFGAPGGIHVLRNGTESPESVVICDLPPGVGRVVKIIVSVENGPLVSQLTMEVN